MLYALSQGWEVEENPDQYGIDLFATKGGETIGIECEVKRVWATQGERFPWGTIQIPVRKKFLDTDLYTLLADNQRYFLVLKGKDINVAAIRVVPNKYIPAGERFYVVPVEFATFYTFPYPVSAFTSCCAGPALTAIKNTDTLLSTMHECVRCGEKSVSWPVSILSSHGS
jgi:hypothetical protein